MLDQAWQRVDEHGWQNVALTQTDAAQYEFPDRVGGIITAFALSFIPDCVQVIENGCRALEPGRKWVVLDMAWPDGWPLWLWHGLFFLRSWGITADVIQRRPWQVVWQALDQHLVGVGRKRFGRGFFYLASGTQPY
jgi:demethylmenaquinone methyltransferase/2-methoxy-6-polyprenyl-1,4-benzoquinol methylase